MARKATRKTRTTVRKKVSLKKRASSRKVAAKSRVVKRATTQKRAPARKKAAGRRALVAKESSAAIELEKLLDTTQAKLVGAWEKEANAAIKTFEALRKKLERAAERQRKLKDKRVAAASRHKAKRSETTAAALEKAKEAYAAAAEVTVELRGQLIAAKTRMKAAKLGLAHAVARDKAMARFSKDLCKAQARKVKATRRRPRKTARRSASQRAEATTAVVESAPETEASTDDDKSSEVNKPLTVLPRESNVAEPPADSQAFSGGAGESEHS